MRKHLVDNIEKTLSKYFSLDEELIKTYHIASGKDVSNCVKKTTNDLSKADSSFKLYEIIGNKKEEFGFYGIEFDRYMTTFFVNPKYRDKKTLLKIWKYVKKQFPETFYTSVYSKNTRALNFYLKNEAKIYKEGTYETFPFVVLEFKENICR